MNDKENKYLVPANVTARFEFFTGFGVKELIYCLIVGAAALAVALIFGFLLSMIVKVVIVAGSIGATFFCVQKNPMTGMSILDLIKSIKAFANKQKRFLYAYKN